jgi:hypothetical protein
VNILVPVSLENKVNGFDHTTYENIEDEIYSHFWDVVVVQNLDNLKVAIQFQKFGIQIVYVGTEKVKNAFNVNIDDIDDFLNILNSVYEKNKEIDVLKKNQDLLFEPISLSSKMAMAYGKLSKMVQSRIITVIAQNGLLEEWILSKTIGSHETFDFSVLQEEEIILRLFGSKNHVPTFLKSTTIVLMNCDLANPASILKTAMASSNGYFSIYGVNEKKSCNANLILHFEKSANVPKAIFQLSGKSSIEIPSLKEILDDLPTIFRYTVSAIAQNSKNFSFNFSDDVFESLKREEWSENWRSFFKFCNAFISGETIIHKGIKSDSEIPKMKDYIKNVTSEGEKVLIKKAIERYKTDKKKICEALGINVKTLNKKIKIYNLK